jgi:hypothetical protein
LNVKQKKNGLSGFPLACRPENHPPEQACRPFLTESTGESEQSAKPG